MLKAKNLFWVVGALAVAPLADAHILTKNEVMEGVQSSLSSARSARGVAGHERNVPLRFVEDATPAIAGELPAYHLLTDGNRVYVAGADSRQRQLLAILPADADLANPEGPMAELLQLYAREAEALQTLPEESGSSRGAEFYDPWQSVAPLLKTSWRQSYPYNMYVPELMPTGCVATAMAQVIYHHRYAEGKGSNSYYCESARKTLTYKFEGHKFAFENMLANYNGSSSEAQRDAVADLMYACGVSVNMAYTPGNSVVSVVAASPALINHFGYDPKGTVAYTREGASAKEWETMVYEEVSAGRPVIYGGITNYGAGHAFVVDGYLNEGLFHINWGWGMYDGYFTLSSLNPQAVYPTGLTEGQQAVTVKVPGRGTAIDRTRYYAGITSADAKGMQVLWRMTGNSERKNAEFGVTATHLVSGTELFVPGTGLVEFNIDDLPNNETVRTLRFDLASSLKTAGTWSLVPSIREKGGKAVPAEAMRNYSGSATAEVAGGKVTVKVDAAQTGGLAISDFTTEGVLYEYETGQFSFTVTNCGETDFSGNIGLSMVREGDPTEGVFPRTSVYAFLRSGDTARYTTPQFELGDKKAGPMTRGRYNVWLVNIDADNAPLSSQLYTVRIYGRDEKVDGVELLPAASPSSASVRYFNLNGVEIASPPAPGIYFRSTPSGISKIVVR